jgi:hypothetical protein
MTGRAAGFCAGYDVPGFANVFFGRGSGRGFGGGGGRGRGRGWRNRFFATGLTGWQRAANTQPPASGPYPLEQAPAADVDVETLKAQARHFEDALQGIRKQIEELESRTEE